MRAPSADTRYFEVRELIHGQPTAHDLRGGPLPEHRRVLGARHRHVPDPRRHVHPGLPLLLRPLGQAGRAARPARAAAPRRRRPSRWSSRTSSSRRSTGTTSPIAAPATSPPRSGRSRRSFPTRPSRCSRRTSSACEEEALRTVLARAARGLQPQHRDGPTPASRGCGAPRRRTTRRSGCSRARREVADYPVLTKSGIIVGLGERTTRCSTTMRDLRGHERRRRHDRPVPPAFPEARARSTAGCTPTSSGCSARRASGWASARSSRARSSARPTAPTSSGTPPRAAAAPIASLSRRVGRPASTAAVPFAGPLLGEAATA